MSAPVALNTEQVHAVYDAQRALFASMKDAGLLEEGAKKYFTEEYRTLYNFLAYLNRDRYPDEWNGID